MPRLEINYQLDAKIEVWIWIRASDHISTALTIYTWLVYTPPLRGWATS